MMLVVEKVAGDGEEDVADGSRVQKTGVRYGRMMDE